MPSEPWPCTWLVQMLNPAFQCEDWCPDSPSDVHVIVPCGAPTRVVKVSAHGTHTECEAGHTHDPYGSPESEASLWEMEMRDRYDDFRSRPRATEAPTGASFAFPARTRHSTTLVGMTRIYTGYDRNARGRRKGTEALVAHLERTFGLRNNGTWVVRTVRGKHVPSVHGTGRAADVSWRASIGAKGGRDGAVAAMDWLVANADALGVEMVIDYWGAPGQPWGRAWRCDRGSWRALGPGEVTGGGHGDWMHVEVSPAVADDPRIVDRVTGAPPGPPSFAFPGPFGPGHTGQAVRLWQHSVVHTPVTTVFDDATFEATVAWQKAFGLPENQGYVGEASWALAMWLLANAAPADAPADDAEPVSGLFEFPGVLKRGSTGPSVKLVQYALGQNPDGAFGPRTEAAVKSFQKSRKLKADGIVGKVTWEALKAG